MTRRFLVKYYYQQKVWCIPPFFFSQYTYYYPQLCSCSKAWLSLIPDILDALDSTVPTRTDRHNDVHGGRTPLSGSIWHAAECTHETAGQRRSSAGRIVVAKATFPTRRPRRLRPKAPNATDPLAAPPPAHPAAVAVSHQREQTTLHSCTTARGAACQYVRAEP